MGCHTIEAARYFIGKDNPVVEVLAWTDRLYHHDRTDAEDNAVLLMRFRGRPVGPGGIELDGPRRPRPAQRSLRHRRRDLHRRDPRDADQGLFPTRRRLYRSRKPRPKPAGCFRRWTKPGSTATARRCGTSWSASPTAACRARPSPTATSSTAFSTPPTVRPEPSVGCLWIMSDRFWARVLANGCRPYARRSWMTCPYTSVSRKSRPA